jgi:hypothetical protein
MRADGPRTLKRMAPLSSARAPEAMHDGTSEGVEETAPDTMEAGSAPQPLVDRPKVEPPKMEYSKAEAKALAREAEAKAHVREARAENVRAEALKADATKAEAAKPESKAEAKGERPKGDRQKVEKPRPEATKSHPLNESPAAREKAQARVEQHRSDSRGDGHSDGHNEGRAEARAEGRRDSRRGEAARQRQGETAKKEVSEEEALVPKQPASEYTDEGRALETPKQEGETPGRWRPAVDKRLRPEQRRTESIKLPPVSEWNLDTFKGFFSGK